jgi:hypothetical protein
MTQFAKLLLSKGCIQFRFEESESGIRHASGVLSPTSMQKGNHYHDCLVCGVVSMGSYKPARRQAGATPLDSRYKRGLWVFLISSIIFNLLNCLKFHVLDKK